jgi:hypothetical protein
MNSPVLNKSAETFSAPVAANGGLTVELAHARNPDIRGGYWAEVPPKGKRLVPVADFAEASRVCQAFINQYGLGGGNWTGGKIRQGGKVVARVSYNGRVWTQEFGHPDCKEIVLEAVAS